MGMSGRCTVPVPAPDGRCPVRSRREPGRCPAPTGVRYGCDQKDRARLRPAPHMTAMRDPFLAFLVGLVPIVIAITFHEASHGYVARMLGDDTAWRLGRITLNPLKHVDPFGTIALPAIL